MHAQCGWSVCHVFVLAIDMHAQLHTIPDSQIRGGWQVYLRRVKAEPRLTGECLYMSRLARLK